MLSNKNNIYANLPIDDDGDTGADATSDEINYGNMTSIPVSYDIHLSHEEIRDRIYI
jgi:hypothetical protein